VVFESRQSKPVWRSPIRRSLAGVVSNSETTNRRNEDRGDYSSRKLEAYEAIAKAKWVQSLKQFPTLKISKVFGEVIGGKWIEMEIISYSRVSTIFVSEIRWSSKKHWYRWGIRYRYLELSKEWTNCDGLDSDPGTMEFFQKFDLGHGLLKIQR